MKLEEAIGRGNEKYDKTCKLCGEEEENLLHFIIKCPSLENKRNYKIIDNRTTDLEQRLIDVLYKQENHRGIGWMIRDMWLKRKDILKDKEDMYRKSQANKKKNKYRMNKSDPGLRLTDQTPKNECIGKVFHTKG